MNPVSPHFARARGALALVFAFFAFSSAFAAEAPGGDDLGQSVGTIPIPPNLSKAEVKDTIIKAFTHREWGIKSEGDDRVVGYLKHRSNEAQLTLVFDQQKIDMFCLGWQIDKKTGVREKLEMPKSWINNIKSDVTKGFNQIVGTK